MHHTQGASARFSYRAIVKHFSFNSFVQCANRTRERFFAATQTPLRKVLGYLLAATILLSASLSTAQADVQYVYDEAGRLVEVIAPNGESAQYQYDPAGNITAINRLAATAVSIAEFTPNSGPIGATVTLWGSGFSTTASQNTVKFNGVTATVTTATANKLVVTVPGSASTGTISVTAPAGAATSTGLFTVASGSAPTVASFTPTTGSVGTAVTINGTNFDPILGNNKVWFNATYATVSAVTATQIQTSVPTQAASGPIKVTTSGGTAVSASDFVIPPGTYTAADIAFTSRIVLDAPAQAYSISTANKVGLITFSRLDGQGMSLALTSVTMGGTIKIYRPDGTLQLTDTIATNKSIDLTLLPMSGTYTILLAPASAIGSATLKLISNATGTIPLNGSATTVALAAGQKGRYTFAGITGQRITLSWNGATFPSYWHNFYVYNPDGSQLSSALFSDTSASAASGKLDLPALLTIGTYTVVVSPKGVAAGQVSIALTPEATGTLAVNGATLSASLTTAQNGRYSFTATAGQTLGLGISGYTVTPTANYPAITIYKPDGTALLNCTGIVTPGGKCNLPALTAGTYSVLVKQTTLATANFTLTLSSDVAGTLVPNGSALTFSTTRIGQNARYTFSGTAGQNLSLTWSGVTFPTYQGTTYIFNPDGSLLTTGGLSATSPNGKVDLTNLPQTGTYTVFASPLGTDIGQATIALKAEHTGTLTADGATLSASLTAGQNGRYSFSGTAGQRLSLGLSSLSFSPTSSSVTVVVYKPDRSVLKNCGVISPSGNKCTFVALPTTGTYDVWVQQVSLGLFTANFTLTLSNDVTGTLAIDGAPLTFNTTRVGQNARYTFSGTAGQNISVTWSGATFPVAWTQLSINRPDGVEISFANLTASSGKFDLMNLPTTGTYTLLIVPAGTGTGQATVSLKQEASGTLTIDGAALTTSLSAGQNGRYSFSGTAGQRLGLGMSGVTVSPAGSSVPVTIYKPDGSVFPSCGSLLAAGSKCNLPALPTTGTYKVLVQQATPSTANFTLTLSSDITGTLAIDGAPLTFNTTRVGQNARYTFSGTAGQNLSATWSGATFPVAWTEIYVYRPDGAQIGYAALTVSSGKFDLINLPTTGTYTVLIAPAGTGTGQLTVGLTQEASGTLTADGATLTASLSAGQNGRYSFSGTAGQRLGLGMSGVTLNPAGSSVPVSVYKPDGSVFPSCGSLLAAGKKCNLPALPTTGTYKVWVQQATLSTANFTLTLSNDVTGTLTVGGAPLTFSTTRVGQNARYTFNGTAGQNLKVTWSGATFPSYWHEIFVYRPDGTLVAYAIFSDTSQAYANGSVDIPSLSVTGTYSVFVSPLAAATGQVNIGLQTR